MAFYVVFVRLLRVVTNAYSKRRLSPPSCSGGTRPPTTTVSHRFNPLGSLLKQGPFGINGPFSILGQSTGARRRPTLAPPSLPFDDYDYDLDALDGNYY